MKFFPARFAKVLTAKAIPAAIAAIAITLLPTLSRAEPAAHLVFELETGTLIDQKDAFKPWYPASITKLMTAYVTFRALRSGKITLQSPVLVSARALSEPPSKMGFPVGTRITVDNALKMVLVKSANDIAVALGEGVSGSLEAFLEDMNFQAKRLGMSRTHFNNPHGLPDPGHVTSAWDMAMLSSALMKEFPEFHYLFKTSAIRFGKRRLRSANALLERYPGATGMKTGYICNSGFNMVASAKRSGRTIVAVVLGGASGMDRAVAAAGLLDKGFAQTAETLGSTKLATMVRPSNPGVLPVDGYCKRAKKPTAEALLLRHGSDIQNSVAYASISRSTQEALKLALNPKAKKTKKGKKSRRRKITGGQVLDLLVGQKVLQDPVQVFLGAAIVSVVTGKTPVPAEKPIVVAAVSPDQASVEAGNEAVVRQISTDKNAIQQADISSDATVPEKIEPIDQPGTGDVKTAAVQEPWPKKIGGVVIPQPRPES